MAVSPPICDFGWSAPGFRLPGIDGRIHDLDGLRGPRATLVMFICNHCPYVQAIADRLARDARTLQALGVGVAGIMSNDTDAYPEDSFAHMHTFAARHGFGFPYLIDQTQAVARTYGAVCTPDFFGFDANLGLQYRGRLDASGRQPGPPDARRELVEAMAQIAATGQGPRDQIASLGCSIKWRETPEN